MAAFFHPYMTEPGESSSPPDFINHSFLLLQSLSYVELR